MIRWHNQDTSWKARALDLTQEDLAKIRLDYEAVQLKNKELEDKGIEQEKLMLSAAEFLFGKEHKVFKYLWKESGCWRRYRNSHSFGFQSEVLDYIEAKKKENSKKAFEAEKEQQAKDLVAKAIIYLQARGKKLIEDFSIETAVRLANDIAFDDAIEASSVSNDAFIEFVGSDSCDGCDGWDTSSRRCQCGNRRVSWEKSYGFSFENPEIYANAY